MAERGAGYDPRLEAAVRRRFDRMVAADPVRATFIGIHLEDSRLGNKSREAVEEQIGHDRAFIAELEAIDPGTLDERSRLERDIALHAGRLSLFGLDTQRLWERRADAMDEIGDGLFGLFARDFAPLDERLGAMIGRLEDAPRVVREQRQRLTLPGVRLWDELEISSAEQMPALFAEITAAARLAWPDGSAESRRLAAAVGTAEGAVQEHIEWLRGRLATDNDDFPLGRERYDDLVAHRAFDGVSPDEILEIGWEQLAHNRDARREAARRIDPDATEDEVVDRVKSAHPESFEAALDEYRDAMFRARQHLIDRDLVTLPAGETLSVIATPEYLRNVLPFAAYFEPPRFDAHPSGIYVVTPSIDGDPRAIREHNHASISNTSIHEAYPGHHLQLSAANTHPSLARILVDAPEFVEGWGMYSELMMREHGFDDEPRFLVSLYTDAIWRACRIILDVRLHRGEISVADAIEFLIQQTGFERPNATAEVDRYTYTPGYQVSYLLGRVMLMRLRDDEQRRLGSKFSLKGFHDALIYGGSIPISFHRRLLESGMAATAPHAGNASGGAVDAAAAADIAAR